MEGSPGFVYCVRLDGTGMRRVLKQTILALWAVSPDGRWISAWAPLPGNGPPSGQGFHLMGNLRSLWVGSGWDGQGLGCPRAWGLHHFLERGLTLFL